VKITTQQLATFGGILAILLVVGAAGYFQLKMSSPQAVVVKPTGYSADALTKELLPNGVFTRIGTLTTIPQSSQDATTYQDSELGKVDITKLD
jgi:hypothetical protein